MIKSLVYIKIHKCSSTSVRKLVEDYASKNNLKYVGEPSKPKGFEFLRLGGTNINKINYWNIKNTPYNIFARHQAYNTDFFNSFMEDPIYITFLRNPLERAISCYYSHDVPPYSKIPFDKWYIENEKFLRDHPSYSSGKYLVITNNFMSYMVGFDSLNEITSDNLKKRYKFIGFTEFFDKSIEKLENILGWKFNKRLMNTKVRKNKNKPEIKLSKEFKEMFKNNNSLDYKLYELSKNIY